MFYWFMLAMSLLLPVTMIGFGASFRRRAPGRIQYAYGYRTSMSMKNRDTWTFAHRYFGRLWLWAGAISLPLSAIPFLFVWKREAEIVGRVGLAVVALQLILLLVPVFLTESALRRTFDSRGLRRTPPGD